jgi:hypothetical protein
MTESDNGVPTLAPHDLTYRIGWEVIAWMPEQVTIRAHRIADQDPGDSDGIPQQVEAEVSVRGSSGQITDRAGIGQFITPDVKKNALTALAELAFRDGKGDMLEYPFIVEPEPGKREVCFGILRFKTFQKWFLEMAQFDFADIERAMGQVAGSDNPFVIRRAGVMVMHELKKLLPELQPFDDTPHMLLHL